MPTMPGVALLLGMAQLGQLDAPRPKPKQFVLYVSEAQIVSAGKPAFLELHFRVQDGYHINSHHPSSELEIATAVELTPDAGVQLQAAQYPAGKTYTLALATGEKLDVYTGEFAVRVPLTAKTGEHEFRGALRYQACDQAACYPVKTLPLDVVFTAQ